MVPGPVNAATIPPPAVPSAAAPRRSGMIRRYEYRHAPARRWYPAGEARCLPHWSRNYRRRRRLTRKKDGKKTGSFTPPPFPGGRHSPRPGAYGEQTRRGRDLPVVAAERGEACDEDVGEQAGMAAVRVEVRVEDGHLRADRTRSEGGQQSGQLGRAETAGVGAVHGGHHARIKDVHVQVDPVAVQAGAAGDAEDRARGLLHSPAPDL